jgi:glycosyltransferase involved in cell wall biosynthesis/ribosomal protein S18 acetylase RimI-like enzyme
MTHKLKVAHVATVDLTLRFLLFGQLRRLLDEGYEVVTISAPGPWVADLQAAGIRHIAWQHATRAWDLRSDLLAFVELVRILRRERFDLVHTHNPKPGVLGRIAARLVGIPCVVNTVHGLYATPDDPFAKRALVTAVERLTARFSHLELYQSEEDLAWSRAKRIADPNRSALLGNGTDLSYFDPGHVPSGRVEELKEELRIPADACVVGVVGRLVAEKGYRELFAAAKQVRGLMPNVRFLAVGDVNEEKSDSIQPDEIASAGRDVIFTGWREDVRDLLAAMDIFVLPSWREGVPRSAIEAAAMGKPLVLTDIRGCREVARDGVEAILIPPKDESRLAEAIIQLVRDRALRERLAPAARRRVLERFDEQKVIDRLVDHYRVLLADKAIRHAEAGPPRVRLARPQDAPALARLHIHSLPEGFLSSLGERFLRVFYAALARDKGAITLVADGDEGVIGFAAGVASVGDFYRRFFVRRAIPAAIAAAHHLWHPKMLSRAWETARYARDTGDYPEAELISIGIADSRRGRGLGRQLLEGVLEGLREKGVREVRVMVGADNDPANEFYSRMGFRALGSIPVHRGQLSNLWVTSCLSSQHSSSA